MPNVSEPIDPSLYHPRHWPSWLVIGLWRLSAHLPYAWLYQIGRGIGRALMLVGGSRIEVARRNLALCFPELSCPEREALIRRHFEQLGITLTETGYAWWASDARIEKIAKVEGLEHLKAAQAGGQGVLLVAFHFLAIDLTARIVGRYGHFHALYKVQKNRVFEEVSKRQRLRHNVHLIPHKQVRELLSRGQAGHFVAVVPDQDFGPKRSLFVPFFGVPTATIPNVSDYAREIGCPVLLLAFTRSPDGRGHHVSIAPALDNFPSGDDYADTLRINAHFESVIRAHPEQYLWIHKRFKTRPPGEPPVYG